MHDAISVAEAPGGPAAADAAARWSDIQRRADDLTQTLYSLREAVPPESGDHARIENTLASLQAVRSAMDAERVPGGASPPLSFCQAAGNPGAYGLRALRSPAVSLSR